MTFGRPDFSKVKQEQLREQRARRVKSRRATNRNLAKPVTGIASASMTGGTSGEAVEKENASQSGAYMAAVRSLSCQRCGRPPRSQFCHRDQGKGGSIKTDVREGWAGCSDCHELLGGHAGGGRMPKEARRAEEIELGAKTRAEVMARGLWPKQLALWAERKS